MANSHDTAKIARITRLTCNAYRIPTDFPEADGTFSWNATTLVLVEVSSGSTTGIGYTYSDASVAALINETLAPAVLEHDGWDIGRCWEALQRCVRNLGRDGLAATAISAIDCALWDLKAKLLGLPLARLLGMARDTVPIYGSGGFITYSDAQTAAQLARWAGADGCRWVKMKIGAEADKAAERVRAARSAIGDRTGLFVDANGAMDVKTALACASALVGENVEWFEEPVSSDNLAALRLLRTMVPAPISIAAGEYGYTSDYFRAMLEAQSVDVLQADVTRCGGVTGFMRVAAVSESFYTPLSAHCAPALHLHVACAVPGLRHQEWFHDHVRIESMLFDGSPRPVNGTIAPDLSRPGCGLDFKHADAKRYLLS